MPDYVPAHGTGLGPQNFTTTFEADSEFLDSLFDENGNLQPMTQEEIDALANYNIEANLNDPEVVNFLARRRSTTMMTPSRRLSWRSSIRRSSGRRHSGQKVRFASPARRNSSRPGTRSSNSSFTMNNGRRHSARLSGSPRSFGSIFSYD